ncbi:coadhesin-like [Mya arenaria]|uniref:coadhesin-like n=1 Tax=Mya arenaria TaxID=6604 RepID=UPI0022E7DDD3|nr:coadhesin-like [Mya arenaria]
MAAGQFTACILLLVVSVKGFVVDEAMTTPKGFVVDEVMTTPKVNCVNTDNCDFLNVTYHICNDVQLAKEHCKLFCRLCDAVDGHWSDWGQWSGCDVSCGKGTRSRVRSCDNPVPTHGGDDCAGSKDEHDVCVLESCPVHGGWSGWTAWGSCSVPCGVGLERRDRSCDNPWPSKDGNHCNGDNMNYRVCADALCTDGWDNWSAWSSCTVTCGQGLKNRHRACNATMGTMLGGGCIGNDQEQIACNMTSCDVVVLFYARSPTDRSISSNEKIMYVTVTTNKGGGYNSSNGVFSAPHNGLYLFTSHTCVYGSNYAYTGIVKEGTVLQQSASRSINYEECNSIQAAVELGVGERVWVQGTSTSFSVKYIAYEIEQLMDTHSMSTDIGRTGVYGADVMSHVEMDLGHVSEHVTIPQLRIEELSVSVHTMIKMIAH